MLNNVILMGRLVRDPELKTTGSGTVVVNFTLAVDRDFKNSEGERETDFIDIIAWRSTGEFVAKNFKKGQMASIRGRLTARKWQDKDGNNRIQYAVSADDVYFCGDKKSSDKPATTGVFTEFNEASDDLPF